MNRSKPLPSFLFGALAVVFLLGTLSSVAVGQHIRGALEGTISDQTGALIQGASVTLHNVATGVDTTATSDDRGSFNFQNLEPGTYTITVEKTGFRRSVTKEIAVKVGSVTPVTINLEVDCDWRDTSNFYGYLLRNGAAKTGLLNRDGVRARLQILEIKTSTIIRGSGCINSSGNVVQRNGCSLYKSSSLIANCAFQCPSDMLTNCNRTQRTQQKNNC